MLDTVQQKIDAVKTVGYTVSGASLTSPFWLQMLNGGLQTIALLFGVLIGFSTWRYTEEKRAKLRASDETRNNSE